MPLTMVNYEPEKSSRRGPVVYEPIDPKKA